MGVGGNRIRGGENGGGCTGDGGLECRARRSSFIDRSGKASVMLAEDEWGEESESGSVPKWPPFLCV